jgi:hypothetical protein
MTSSVTSLTKFCVELPSNEYWNTSRPKEIIEVEEQPPDMWGNISFKVLAPASFANKWPIVRKSIYIECSGPSRALDFNDYVQLIHSLKPDIPLPKEWKKDRETVYPKL